MKKISLIIIIIIIVVIAGLYINNVFWKNKPVSADASYFANLIQYKTDSINDTVKLNKILENTELGKYIKKIDKNVDNGKEYLTIYFDGRIENDDERHWFNGSRNSIIEKNAVVLFALINNLEKITYSDMETIDQLGTYYTEDMAQKYDREKINSYYNQDVRNYIKNPNEFLKYSIDTSISHITVYSVRYNGTLQTKKIEVNNNDKIKQIADLIKRQNFGVPNNLCLCTANTYVDLNNGYVIGLMDGNLGTITKGNGKDIFENGKGFGDAVTVDKTLPDGLQAIIMDIVNNNTGEIL